MPFAEGFWNSFAKVLGRKQQNDRERWMMLDGSFIRNLPDVWALNQSPFYYPVKKKRQLELLNTGR